MSLIERDLAIRAIAEDMLEMAITENPDTGDTVEDWMLTAESILSGVPDAEPEITDEQAILHLQSTGWMQNHDKAMYESGLREQLADDSGSYDSLIQTQPEIIYCKDCKHRPKATRADEKVFYGFSVKFPDEKCPCYCEDGWYGWYPEDDFYCGYAERREDERSN